MTKVRLTNNSAESAYSQRTQSHLHLEAGFLHRKIGSGWHDAHCSLLPLKVLVIDGLPAKDPQMPPAALIVHGTAVKAMSVGTSFNVSSTRKQAFGIVQMLAPTTGGELPGGEFT